MPTRPLSLYTMLLAATPALAFRPATAASSGLRSLHVSAAKAVEAEDTVLARFGVIADTQYADVEDGTNAVGNRVRRYRQSLQIFGKAVAAWNSLEPPLNFGVELGDLFDAKCRRSRRTALEHVQQVLEMASWTGRPQWHVPPGNHEFYAFGREELHTHVLSQAPSSSQLYYDFSPVPGWRFCVLDGYEVSTVCPAEGKAGIAKAIEWVSARNPNLDASNIHGGGNWLQDVDGDNRRFVPYNGALGQGQLAWFDGVLAAAESNKERVVVFCHMPVFPACSNFNNLLWNYQEILAVLAAHPQTVVAWFAGHDHDGGYAVDERGVHHIVPCAPIECGPGEVSYGHVDVLHDRLRLHWTGKTPRHGESATGTKLPWPTELAPAW